MAKAPEQEWENVTEGARINVAFNDIGDTLIGVFVGTQTVDDPNNPDESWEQYLFDDCEYPEDVAGEGVAVNAGYDLRRALDQIEPGKFLVRVQYARNIPMRGQPSPMKGFKVDRKPLTQIVTTA
jgi:hypothetical protein